MVGIISIFIGLFLVLLLTPMDIIFPDHNIKKVSAQVLDSKSVKEKSSSQEKSLLNKIADIGMIFTKIFNIKWSLYKRKKMENKLLKAGKKNRFNPESFLGLKIGMFVVGSSYGGVLSLLTPVPTIKYICYSTGIICFFWPNTWLKRAITERQNGIIKEMPFVLSSVAIITESGQSIMQSIQEVSSVREGPLSEEFKTTILEIQMGYSRIQAFEHMMDRVQVTELSIFLSALNQSIEKGGSGVSQLLKKQSNEMWKKRKENAKKLAEQASIKLFLPLLILVLPAMMIFLLTPAILSLIELL
jgi:tight adherence protein C